MPGPVAHRSRHPAIRTINEVRTNRTGFMPSCGWSDAPTSSERDAPRMIETNQGPKLFDTGVLIAGRYEVVATVGTGGMGWVLHVIDRALAGKSVALKVLYPHLVQDSTTFSRFKNEVVVARDLNHPNIVRTFDIGQTESGFHFISMEYVHGTSLKDLIYNGSGEGLPVPDAIRVLQDIVEGIAHAHSKGVIHRDLKPDNILVSKLGEVKIADFGIARSIWQDHGLTKTGGAVGTPYYMAPEQLRGEPVDHRADVYAIGIIAFELIAGRRPFDDTCFLNLAQMHFDAELPPLPHAPEWYQELARRAAAKSPEDRFLSTEEIAEVLRMNAPPGQIRPIQRAHYHSSVSRAFLEISRRAQAVTTVMPRMFWMPWIVLGTILCLIGLGFIRTNSTIRAQTVWPLLKLERSLGVELTPLKALFNVRVDSNELTDLLSIDRPKSLFDAIEGGIENEGDKFAVRLLMLAGMDPNTRDEKGRTALQVALERGKYKAVGELLRYKADPNLPDLSGRPTIIAMLNRISPGHLRQLLLAGARADVADDDGNTLLHHAAARGYEEIVRRLLDKGADPKVLNAKGQTPLFYTLLQAHWSREVVELLLAHGSPTDTVDIEGKKLLDSVAGRDRAFLKQLIGDSD